MTEHFGEYVEGDTYTYRSVTTLEMVTWTRDAVGNWTASDGRDAVATDADVAVQRAADRDVSGRNVEPKETT